MEKIGAAVRTSYREVEGRITGVSSRQLRERRYITGFTLDSSEGIYRTRDSNLRMPYTPKLNESSVRVAGDFSEPSFGLITRVESVSPL